MRLVLKRIGWVAVVGPPLELVRALVLGLVLGSGLGSGFVGVPSARADSVNLPTPRLPTLTLENASGALFERMGLQTVQLDRGALLIGGFAYAESVCLRDVSLVHADGHEELLPIRLAVGRNHFRTAKLDENRVLVMGGFSQDYGSLAEVELLNLDTGVVDAWPWLAVPAELFASIQLPGKAVIFGGLMAQISTQTWDLIQTVDLQTREVTVSQAHLATSRFGHEAIWLPALGKALIVGGKNVSRGPADPVTGKKPIIWTALKSMEFWDPATDQVTPAGDLTIERDRPQLHLMPDGKVLVIGGAANDPATPKLNSIELYDPVTQTSAVIGSLAVGRMAASVVPLGDQGVIVAGGWVDDPEGGKAIEYFDFTSHATQTIGHASATRAENGMLWLNPGELMLVGGKDAFAGRDPATYHFQTTEIFRVSSFGSTRLPD